MAVTISSMRNWATDSSLLVSHTLTELSKEEVKNMPVSQQNHLATLTRLRCAFLLLRQLLPHTLTPLD